LSHKGRFGFFNRFVSIECSQAGAEGLGGINSGGAGIFAVMHGLLDGGSQQLVQRRTCADITGVAGGVCGGHGEPLRSARARCNEAGYEGTNFCFALPGGAGGDYRLHLIGRPAHSAWAKVDSLRPQALLDMQVNGGVTKAGNALNCSHPKNWFDHDYIQLV